MKLFLETNTGSKLVTVEDIKDIMSNGIDMGPLEVLEVVQVDDNGDIHLEITAYGVRF
jgi:hypothetical protein